MTLLHKVHSISLYTILCVVIVCSELGYVMWLSAEGDLCCVLTAGDCVLETFRYAPVQLVLFV